MRRLEMRRRWIPATRCKECRVFPLESGLWNLVFWKAGGAPDWVSFLHSTRVRAVGRNLKSGKRASRHSLNPGIGHGACPREKTLAAIAPAKNASFRNPWPRASAALLRRLRSGRPVRCFLLAWPLPSFLRLGMFDQYGAWWKPLEKTWSARRWYWVLSKRSSEVKTTGN